MKNKWRNIIITTVVLVLKNIHSQFSSFCQLLINVSDLPEGKECQISVVMRQRETGLSGNNQYVNKAILQNDSCCFARQS